MGLAWYPYTPLVKNKQGINRPPKSKLDKSKNLERTKSGAKNTVYNMIMLGNT